MNYLYKYFLILISPLILSYIVPLIMYDNIKIGLFSIGEHHSRKYLYFQNGITLKSFLLIAVWIFLSFLLFHLLLTIEKKLFRKNYLEKKINFDYRKLYYFLIFLSIVGNLIAVVHNFFIFPGSFEEVVHQLSLMPILIAGLGCFILRFNNNSLTNYQLTIVLFLIILSIFNGLLLYMISSRSAYVLYFMISILLIVDYSSKNLRLKIILIIFLIFSTPFLMTLKVYIRNNFYTDGITRISIKELQGNNNHLEIIKNFTNILSLEKSQQRQDLKSEIYEFYDFDRGNSDNMRFNIIGEEGYLNYVIRRVTARVNHLNITNYYFSIFPDVYPYLGSDYLHKLFSGVVPRFFWKNKPQNNLANTLPILTKLLPPYDRTTSFNLNILEEGIAFQGVLGLLIVGMIYSLTVILTFATATFFGNLYLILLPLCGFTLLNTESGLYGVFNGVLHTIFIYCLLLFIINFFCKIDKK